MLHKVTSTVWKITGKDNVNLYYLNIKPNIVIDAGNRADHSLVKYLLSKLVPLDQVEKVLFTHLHHDHIGNFDLFPNASFYASKQEIECFKQQPEFTILDSTMFKKFNAQLNVLVNMHGLKVINSPGHTKGSVCLYYEEQGILFTGDTMFARGIGRTDLPTSIAEEMDASLEKIKEIPYKILCPGHDY